MGNSILHVLVIGGSKGIGLETVRKALANGHHVRAFARSAGTLRLSHDNLEKRSGDALKQTDVDAALDGIDVVVQALGVRSRDLMQPVTLFSEATRVLLPAMERRGVRRLITVTGFGAGDSQQAISCLQRVPFRLFLGRAYDDKDVQERLIKDSQLDWTIVRPGVLLPGPGSGNFKVLVEPAQWRNGPIQRGDVAQFIVTQLTDDRFVRQAPVLVSC